MEKGLIVPQVFKHKKFGEVRIVVVNGKVWFVAADVCRALDLSNVTVALAGLKPQERAKFNLGHPYGETNCINEPGVYRLIFKSRKPEAEEFQDWVVYDVLPSIARTGNYIGNPAAIESPIAPTVPQNIHIHTNDFNTEVSANWEKIRTAEALIQAAKLVSDNRIKKKILAKATMMLAGEDFFELEKAALDVTV